MECVAGPHNPADYFAELGETLAKIPVNDVERIIKAVSRCYSESRNLFLFGNGGSAALASHHACDMGKGTIAPSQNRFRVVSLTDNVPLITAWANDVGYEHVFVEQLKNLACAGDVSFAISASGNSPNILRALEYSRAAGMVTVGVTGFDGGKMLRLCDIAAVVPSNNMQIIEDLHVAISHAVFTAVRQEMLASASTTVARAASV